MEFRFRDEYTPDRKGDTHEWDALVTATSLEDAYVDLEKRYPLHAGYSFHRIGPNDSVLTGEPVHIVV